MRLRDRLPSFTTLAVPALALVSLAGNSQAQEDHPGYAVYQQFCAACHNDPANSRAPALDAIQQMSNQALRFSLTAGVMQQQASMLDEQQLHDVVDYLAADAEEGDWVAGMMCGPNQRDIDLTASASLPMVGVNHKSTRHLTPEQVGLKDEDLKNLELAWAIGFPNTRGLRSSPVIVGSTLFYTPDPTGKLLAMDTQSGCVKWAYDAGGPLRTSISYGELGEGGEKALIFAGRSGEVHAIKAATGELIWKNDPRHSERAGITGSPVLFKNKIFVPLSASGVGAGANPNYECCSEHGALAAMNAKTGELEWTYHTMPDAEYTGEKSKTGVKLRGPSGAPIWSTPTVDVERGVVYVTTGQNTSLPATDTSDAVIAVDIATGEQRWSFQGTPNDVWNLACRVPWEKSGPNCPSPEDSILKDWDFGGAAILAPGKDGKEILVAGQKSGHVWALDPDNKGKLLWQQRFGDGSPLGGIHWGIAIDGKRVYAPLNDPAFADDKEYQPEPSMNAVDLATGEVAWRTMIEPDCSPERKERFALCDQKYGLSALPLAIDESVVSAGVDGRIYVFDGETGEIVWQFDSLREFDTLNGVEGEGGAIESHSIAAGDGMIFIGSGYGGFRQPTGNVLLAFKPKTQ